MKVDFNALRVNTSNRMDRLIEFLNNRIDSDGVIKSFDADDIEELIDDVRDNIVIIGYVYSESDADFADVSDKINIRHFNVNKGEENESI